MGMQSGRCTLLLGIWLGECVSVWDGGAAIKTHARSPRRWVAGLEGGMQSVARLVEVGGGVGWRVRSRIGRLW